MTPSLRVCQDCVEYYNVAAMHSPGFVDEGRVSEDLGPWHGRHGAGRDGFW